MEEVCSRDRVLSSGKSDLWLWDYTEAAGEGEWPPIGGSGRPGRLDSDEVMKVLWRGMLEKLISNWCNFISNAFSNGDILKNEVSVGWSRSNNNSTGKRVLDVLKAIQLSFWKTIVQGIAEIKYWVNKRCANGLISIEVYDWADATKITGVVETCTRDRRNLIFESWARIKDNRPTKIASWNCRRNRCAIVGKKHSIVNFVELRSKSKKQELDQS